jgi:hypothetical protein
MVNFEDLLDDDEAPVTDPRDIFLTLDRAKRFSFPRDIQTEVMKAWFQNPDNQDTVIKLNVGSGENGSGTLASSELLERRQRASTLYMPRQPIGFPSLRGSQCFGS